mmetsp:Transcript_8215/g.7628  ORF Transcript_8215/g.7628 Transcript_8215/m.7628 type:complete len:113 (-) Transcript_8215:2593-2931(-)
MQPRITSDVLGHGLVYYYPEENGNVGQEHWVESKVVIFPSFLATEATTECEVERDEGKEVAFIDEQVNVDSHVSLQIDPMEKQEPPQILELLNGIISMSCGIRAFLAMNSYS